MKAKDFIEEHKKGRRAVKHNPKPRSPVAHAAQSVIGGSASGAHKDKKKAEKQGDVKHKQQSVPMESTLSELSTELLGKYKKAAHADAKKADAEGDYARGDKRFKGINKATNKQFDNDLKKHGQKGVAEGGYDQGRADPRAPSLGAQDRREFKRAELQHELGHERNNIAVSINGKLWKVFAGKGTADSFEERQYLNHMRTWAEKKSASSGKKWTVHLTGADPTT
jgi:hypothetical protein